MYQAEQESITNMQGFGKIVDGLTTTTRQPFEWNGGEGVLLASCSSTWGTRTLKLQQKIGTEWVDIVDAELTEAGGFKFVSTAPELGIIASTYGNPLYISVQSI